MLLYLVWHFYDLSCLMFIFINYLLKCTGLGKGSKSANNFRISEFVSEGERCPNQIPILTLHQQHNHLHPFFLFYISPPLFPRTYFLFQNISLLPFPALLVCLLPNRRRPSCLRRCGVVIRRHEQGFTSWAKKRGTKWITCFETTIA